MTRLQRRAATCLSVFLFGCSAGWQPVTIPQPKPLDERTVLQFHVMVGKKDSTARLHAVQFTADSISGVYWLDHTSCDTCKTSYAIKDVTRAQIGDPGRPAWVIGGPFFLALGAGLIIGCIAYCWYHGD